jgi:hypothetical protein
VPEFFEKFSDNAQARLTTQAFSLFPRTRQGALIKRKRTANTASLARRKQPFPILHETLFRSSPLGQLCAVSKLSTFFTRIFFLPESHFHT